MHKNTKAPLDLDILQQHDHLNQSCLAPRFHGWEELGERIKIKCFTSNPSIKSSLKFLRKTPWARLKVENLYLRAKWVDSTK